MSNAEIGRELRLTEATVKAHVSRVLAKAGPGQRGSMRDPGPPTPTSADHPSEHPSEHRPARPHRHTRPHRHAWRGGRPGGGGSPGQWAVFSA
ncbi:LuxR C-terminal-related transcriptional regulator [Nonomuraea rubra]|uniref:LuxR C-terminal-related transcriptional regulator n=1 Tax=Nonomuraea rubra TaxID=46180 RepID=UPI003CD07CB8